MADGTASLRVLKAVLEKAQKEINPVTQSYLNFETAVSKPPSFVSNVYFRIVPEPGQSNQSFFEELIYMNKCPDPRMGISLAVAAAMVNCIDTLFWPRLRTTLKEAEYIIEEQTLENIIALHPSYDGLIDPNHTAFADAQGSHYIYAVTLLLTLIGKSLISANFAAWMRRRRSSFAGPLSLSVSDELLDILAPSSQVAYQFNQEVRALWTIRREFFLEIWAQHDKPSLLGRGFQVTLVLLRFAEFSNFHMPALWLVLANPILLMWSELNKDLPYLCAAFEKYHSIGDLAPWAKLFLPNNELEEFGAERLARLYAVAKHVASIFGPPSINQIRGVAKNPHIIEICDRAITIIRAAGRANSRDTQALRLWKYGDLEKNGLMEELKKPLGPDDTEQAARRASIDLNERT